ncbi:primase C-terminal domain-containing protein, partial [Klebsiella pneumoniae]
ELYTLDWLADFLDLNAANEKEIVADYGLGRNCTLFDKTRKWAYRAIRQGWPEYEQWLQACYERASAYNLQFAVPLDENEVSGIAKSIAKWTSSKFSEESFSDFVKKTHTKKIQSKRGVLSGKSRRIGSLEDTRPWDDLGISRRKYFYMKKNGEGK